MGFQDLLKNFKWNFSEVSILFQKSFKKCPTKEFRVFQESFKKVSMVFQGGLRGDSMEF